MAKLDLPTVWRDIVTYRRAYLLTVVASFGGMVSRFKQVFPSRHLPATAFRMGYRSDWWCPDHGRFPRVFQPRP